MYEQSKNVFPVKDKENLMPHKTSNIIVLVHKDSNIEIKDKNNEHSIFLNKEDCDTLYRILNIIIDVEG